MSRKRMVTRTLISTTAKVYAINENGDPYMSDVTVVGDFEGKPQEKLLNEIKKKIPTAVYVKETTTIKERRGMEESKFFELAEPILSPFSDGEDNDEEGK